MKKKEKQKRDQAQVVAALKEIELQAQAITSDHALAGDIRDRIGRKYHSESPEGEPERKKILQDKKSMMMQHQNKKFFKR